MENLHPAGRIGTDTVSFEDIRPDEDIGTDISSSSAAAIYSNYDIISALHQLLLFTLVMTGNNVTPWKPIFSKFEIGCSIGL